MNTLYVTCSTGLEELLLEELQELGYTEVRKGFRGVYVENSSLNDVYRINYASRIAIRVLLPLLNFRCKDRDDLYQSVLKYDWGKFFKKAKTMAIDANVDHPLIRNSLFAAQVVKDAICDQLVEATGKRPSIDTKNPDLQLNLFLRNNSAVLSFDTSLQPLHKRGYRQEGGEAPLRETLAAALLRLAKYQPEEIFIDPCAGSGTFLIEAALMAAQIAPGRYRKNWGFFLHPDFSDQEWLKMKNAIDAKEIPLLPNRFFACEINKNMHRIMMGNCRAAGVYSATSLFQGDFKTFESTILPTFMITNPPYGQRLEEEETLKPLYRSLGDFMKRKMAKPSRGFILTGSLALSKEIGLASKQRIMIDNGGVEARFLPFDIY